MAILIVPMSGQASVLSREPAQYVIVVDRCEWIKSLQQSLKV